LLADLLLAAEGELPPAAQYKVSEHLRRCAGCQARLATTASVIEVVRQVMKPFGETDTGDAAVEARYQRFLEKLHARKQQRIHRPPSASPFRRWLPLAASLLVAAMLFFAPHGAVIQADELVKHAVSVEHARPAGSGQHLLITLTPAQALARAGVGVPSYSAEVDITDGIITTSGATAPDSQTATLISRLARHRFEWRRPLSVGAFDAWRHGLARKQDAVIDLRGVSLVTLRTTTPDAGELREVELTVQRDSYRVVREVFKFEDGGLLTVEALTPWGRRRAPATVAAAASTSVSTMPVRPTRVLDQAIAPVPAAPPDLARWLERSVGDASARAAFMPELRRLTRATRQHLTALRDLAAHDPGVEGAEFSPAARARFDRQRNLQYESLRDDLNSLSPRILALTLQPNEERHMPTAASSQIPVDWARRIDAGLSHAATLDRLAADLRAYDDLPSDMRQRVADSFTALLSAMYTPAP
jgi:hypothetical protein